MRFRLLCALRRPYAIRWISLILLLKPSVIPLVERCRMERTIGSNQRCKVPATRCSDSWALWLARAISLHHASLAGLSYVRFTTLTQQVMQLIHGVGSTGQEGTVLQCLHGGSPLASVVHVIPPLFQSGEAPSRGPRSIQGSTEQTASIFIHQYVIYTQGKSSCQISR